MKNLFLVLFLSLTLFITNSFAQQNIIEFKHSKLYGLINFLKSIHSTSFDENVIQKFNKSKFATPENKEFVEEFYTLLSSKKIQLHSEEKEFISKSFLENLALNSSSLDQFVNNISPFYSLGQIAKIKTILTKFSAIYEEYSWNNSNLKLTKIIDEYNKLSNSVKVRSSLSKLSNFYNRNWPKDIKISIYLYPSLKGSSHVNRYFKLNQTLAINVLKPKINENLTKILHEVSHTFFANRSHKLKKEEQRAIKNSRNKKQVFAFRYFDEVIATIISQKIIKNSLNQVIDQKWDENYIVNDIAKSFSPFVEKYIKAGKKIDTYLLKEYFKIFTSTYPSLEFNTKENLRELAIITDQKRSLSKIKEEFSRLLAPKEILGAKNLTSLATAETLKNSKDKLQIFITDNKKELERLLKGKDRYRMLTTELYKLRKPAILIDSNSRGDINVIMYKTSDEDLSKAIFKLKSFGHLKLNRVLVNL